MARVENGPAIPDMAPRPVNTARFPGKTETMIYPRTTQGHPVPHIFPFPLTATSPLTPLTNRLTPLTKDYSVVTFLTQLPANTTLRVSSLTIKLLAHPLASPLPHSGRLVMSLAYGEPPYKLFICIFRKKISCNPNSPRIN